MATIDLSQTGGKRAAPRDWLRLSATFCFLSIAAGQLLFTAFILLFYGVRTATANIAGWNDKPMIDGYVAGDDTGNLMFALHVLLRVLRLHLFSHCWFPFARIGVRLTAAQSTARRFQGF